MAPSSFVSILCISLVSWPGPQDTPQNKGVLEAIAQSESAKILNQYRDRLHGLATLAGFVNIEIQGHIRAITYSFTPTSGLETTIDMRNTVPFKIKEEFLSQKQIDYLRRQVPKGSFSNDIGGWTVI